MMKNNLKALFLLGTLKKETSKDFSHTRVLCEVLIEKFKQYSVESEVERLVEYKILHGVKSNMGKGDEWPKILKKILVADIIIFATPIWWGTHSSLIQQTMERMDELNDEIIDTGKSELLNKVGGMVITGAEDGAENIIATLSNFMVWNGITLPPACSLSYLGDYKDETRTTLKEKFLKQKYTNGMAETMARNLSFMARLLKNNPLPIQEANAQRLN